MRERKRGRASRDMPALTPFRRLGAFRLAQAPPHGLDVSIHLRGRMHCDDNIITVRRQALLDLAKLTFYPPDSRRWRSFNQNTVPSHYRTPLRVNPPSNRYHSTCLPPSLRRHDARRRTRSLRPIRCGPPLQPATRSDHQSPHHLHSTVHTNLYFACYYHTYHDDKPFYVPLFSIATYIRIHTLPRMIGGVSPGHRDGAP